MPVPHYYIQRCIQCFAGVLYSVIYSVVQVAELFLGVVLMSVTFYEKLFVEFIKLFKWPIAVFTIWMLLPNDFNAGEMIKDMNLKSLEVGASKVKIEISPENAQKAMASMDKVNDEFSGLRAEISRISGISEDSAKKIESVINEIEGGIQKVENNLVQLFSLNDERSFVFGDKSEKYLKYSINRTDGSDIDAIFYIDEFPFDIEVDFC